MGIEELRKSNDRHQGREKQINKGLKNTELEIQAFQNEKQAKLNELDIYIVLKLSQLCCFQDEEEEDSPSSEEEEVPSTKRTIEMKSLPDMIESCLVFSRETFNKLHNRIPELEQENKEKKLEYK